MIARRVVELCFLRKDFRSKLVDGFLSFLPTLIIFILGLALGRLS